MKVIEYLDERDILQLVWDLDAGPIRDMGLLESSANRPRARPLGKEAYPTPATKAAALLHSLAQPTGPIESKKSGAVAWLAATVFLELNGYRPDLKPSDAARLVRDVIDGEMNVESIADHLHVVESERE